MLCFVFSALVVLLDQFFKRWVVLTIPLNDKADLIPGVVGLTHVQNSGAAFSILADQRWILVGISFIACILLITILLRYNEGFWGTLGLSALLGGAAGNLIDRLFNGYVVDMFEPLFMDFAIFNIADIFITLGGITFCLFFIITSIKAGTDKRKAEDTPEDQEDDEESYRFFDYDQEDEGFDRLAETKIATKKQRAARSKSHRRERAAPEPEPDSESDEDFDPETGSDEYFDSEQEAEEYFDTEPEMQVYYYDGESEPEEQYDTRAHDDGAQVTGAQVTGAQVTGAQTQVEATSALDALSALESELTDDLLGDYDVDSLLREYGFEDDKPD